MPGSEGERGTITPDLAGPRLEALTESRRLKWGQKDSSLPSASAATLLVKHFCLFLFTPLLTESEAFESCLLVYPIKHGFPGHELEKRASMHVAVPTLWCITACIT